MDENNAVDIYLNFVANLNDLDSDLKRLSDEISKTLSSKDTDLFKDSIANVRNLSKEILKIASNSETFGEDMRKNSDFVKSVADEVLKLRQALDNDPSAKMNEGIQRTLKTLKSYESILMDLSKNDTRSGKKLYGMDVTKSTTSASSAIDELRAKTILAGRSLEEYRQQLIDVGIDAPKAFNYKDVLRYDKQLKELSSDWEKYLNSGKQEKWSDDVVAKRTELLNESLAVTQQITDADTEVAASQEQINELDRINEDLNRRKLATHYQLLEVQKQIAAAETSRLTTGEPQDKENWKMLKEQEIVLKQQEKMYDRQIKQNGILRKTMEETLKTSQEQTDETNKQTEAEKQRKEEIEKSIRAEQENIKQAKSATSQYYYRLRSMKMLNRYLQMANTAMNNFGRKAISVFGKAGKAVTNFTKKFKLFHLNIKKANKDLNNHVGIVKRANTAHRDWGKTLKGGITTLLKYTLGIRSLYILFNRLRGAMSDGMQVMATQYGSVNATMSNIVTSLNQMKNALTTAIQPLTLILAPILEHFANTLSNVTVKIASFFAAFTGQKVVYKAIRVNKDYIDTLKKEKKAMKDLNQEQLAHYDMLNIIDQKKEDEDEEDLSDIIGFEEIPIEANKTLVDFVKKLKDLLKQLLQPLINAWNKWKEAIKEALRKLWDAIKKLVKDILRDFLEVWNEFAQAIAENILATLKNIIDFIRIIVEKIDEAWNFGRNGYRILRAIFGILLRITATIRRMSDYLVKWAEQLTLIPLFSAIADAMEEIEANMQNILDLTFTLWQGLLEIVKYLIERAAPKLADIFSDLVVIVNNIAGALNKVLSNGDDIFDENDRLYRILQDIEAIVDIILDGIKECLEATKEWSANLEKPLLVLFDRIEQVIRSLIKPAVQDIVDLLVYLYEDVLLTLAYWMIGTLMPILVETFGWLVGAVGNIAKGIREALQESERGNDIIWNLIGLFNIVLDKVKELAQYTYDWANQLDFAPYFESLKTLLQDLQPLLEAIMNIVGAIYTEVVLKFVKYLIEEGLPKLNTMISEFVAKVDWDHLTSKVSEFLSAFEKFLEKAWETFVIILGDLGDAFAKFVNSESFDHIVDILIKWMNNADPEKMAKGIEKLVIEFIKLKAALSFLTYLGAFKEFVMTLINWGNNMRMVSTVNRSTEAINSLRNSLNGVETASESSIGALQLLGGVLSIVSGSFMSLGGFCNQLNNGFNLVGFAVTAAGDALIAFGLIALGVAGPIAIGVAAAILAVEEFFVYVKERMDSFGESLPEAINNAQRQVIILVGKFFENVGKFIGQAIGTLMKFLVDSIAETIRNFDGDWLELGKDIVLGILRAFFMVPWLCVQAVGALLAGIVEGIRNAFDMHSPSQHPEILQLGIDILGGILQGIINGILGFPDWVITNVLIPIKDGFIAGVQSIWGDLVEAGSNLFGAVKDGVLSKARELVSELILKWQEIKANAEEWWSNISDAIFNKWIEIKNNAQTKFEEIRSTIEAKWSEMKQNAIDWWTEIFGDLSTWWDNVKNEAHTKFEETRRTIEEKWSEAKNNAESWWNTIFGELQGKWQEIIGEAQSKFEELRSSIENKWNEVKSNAENKWDEIRNAIGSRIDSLWDFVGRMKDFGRDVINGFVDGINDAWDSAGDFVHNVWESVSDGVCDFFGIHSPSRLFMYYGEMLTEGLAEGIEEDSSSTDDAIEGLIPGLDAFDEMYDRIMSKLTDLRKDAVDIIHSMIDDINIAFASMNNLDVLDSISSQLAQLNNIKIPDIALGKVISPQIELSVNADTSKLENLLEQVLDKLDVIPGDNNSDKSPIVLQLDKTELARAVWDEQEKRYKQLGRVQVFS